MQLVMAYRFEAQVCASYALKGALADERIYVDLRRYCQPFEETCHYLILVCWMMLLPFHSALLQKYALSRCCLLRLSRVHSPELVA